MTLLHFYFYVLHYNDKYIPLYNYNNYINVFYGGGRTAPGDVDSSSFGS